MIIRNGINSILRAKGKTILFALLILILTASLTLGVSLWVYSGTLLEQMDAQYTSVAYIEYLGADYPNEHAADNYARVAAQKLDTDAISRIPGVLSWENTNKSLVSVEGYERLHGTIPYSDHAVLICTQFTPLYTEGMVEYANDELPERYIALDESSQQAIVRLSNGTVTQWLPIYHFVDGHEYIHMTLGPVSADDLPNEYILIENKGYSSEYSYICAGQNVQRFATSWRQKQTTVFRYDPETASVWGTGQVIRGYTGICLDPLYSREYDREFLVTVEPEDGLVLEKGTRYIIHGVFTPNGNNHNNLTLKAFYDGCSTLPYERVADGTYSDIFDTYAKKYQIDNNYIQITFGDNISSMEVFHQNTLTLMQGRFPAPDESAVCVVSYDIAQQLELEVGDSFSYTLLSSEANDRFLLSDTGEEKTLTVVGICAGSDEYSGNIWASNDVQQVASPLFGFELGRAVLDNRTAREAADQIQAMCPENVRVTLYDQGYSAAAQPIQAIQTTALSITIAVLLSTLAVLFLYAYLFVGRQQDTVQVLVSLGTTKVKIRLWLLSGSVLLCFVFSSIGALTANLCLDRIIAFALRTSQKLYSADRRYSEAAVGFAKKVSIDHATSLWPVLFSALLVIAAATLLCVIFLNMACKRSVPKRGRIKVRVPKGGTSVFGHGPFRYAWLGVFRGGWRSAVVPIVVFCLSVLMSVLSNGTSAWDEQLERLQSETKIQGIVVSTNGRQHTNISISADDARNLWHSDMLDSMAVSIGWNYWMDGQMPEFGDSEFALDDRNYWISTQPKVIALNDLAAAPDFMYDQSAEVVWLDGWDESFLESNSYYSFMSTRHYFEMGRLLSAENQPTTYPCLVSDRFLAENQLTLGDSVSVNMKLKHYAWEEEMTIDLKVVGAYAQVGSNANIYVPLSFWGTPDWVFGDSDVIEPGQRVTMVFENPEDRDDFLYFTTRYSTCVFRLKDAIKLDIFRDYLEDRGYSQVGKLSRNRTTILLHDQRYVETLGALNRYIAFSEGLFPALFSIIALLGFVVSWLISNGRRMEFAILRGLGASAIRVFLSFFIEQLILCFAGGLLACIVVYAFGLHQIRTVGLLLLCYLLGSAASMIVIGRTNLMQLLSERE